MLRLMLLRHAKASAETATGDHARPLSQRGHHQAQAMAAYMVQEGLLPDQIMASDATRTRETGDDLVLQLDGHPAVEQLHSLYLAHPRTLLDSVHTASAKARALLMIGHNPGLAELADALTGYGDRYAVARMRSKYPPCGLTVLDFDAEDWRDIGIKQAKLDRFIIPADLAPGLDD